MIAGLCLLDVVHAVPEYVGGLGVANEVEMHATGWDEVALCLHDVP